MSRVSFIRWLALLVVAMVLGASTTTAFAPPSRLVVVQQRRTIEQRIETMRMANKNEKDEKDDNDVSDDGDMFNFAPTPTASLVTNLQSAFVAAAWAFLAFGVILNLFGYDYVMRDGHLAIDTTEAAQFQKEVVKASKNS